jgi:hypothetical protein
VSDLLPCPFCGGPVRLERARDTQESIMGTRKWWGVVCRNTINLGGTCAIEQLPSASEKAAVERWNRRATPAKCAECNGSGSIGPERDPCVCVTHRLTPPDTKVIDLLREFSRDDKNLRKYQREVMTRGADEIERSHALLKDARATPAEPDTAPDHKQFVLIIDRNYDGEGYSLGVWDKDTYVMTDGDCFEREGDTLDGYTAEFLTDYELERKLEAARATPAEPDSDVRNRVIEECVQACLSEAYTPNVGEYRVQYNRGVEDCAAAIRARARNGTEAT